jgi:hypothetical protein
MVDGGAPISPGKSVPAVKGSRAVATSTGLANRWAGDLDIMRATTASSAGGISGRLSRSDGTGACPWAHIFFKSETYWVSVNGGRPANKW